MRYAERSIWFLIALFLVFWLADLALLAADNQQLREEKIGQLIRQLDADTAQLRDQAEQALFDLVPTGDETASEDYLRKLSTPHERMPEEVQLRLSRIVEKIATRLAHQTVAPTRITLQAERLDLDQLLAQVDHQTGNHLIDYRERFGQESGPRSVTITLEDQLFWPAMDKILDAAKLELYPFSGATGLSGDTGNSESTGLAVINREPGKLPRQKAAQAGRVCYVDAFRIEAVKVVANRSLRYRRRDGLRVDLEIAWEPRLRPISLAQPAAMISAVDKDGTPLAVANPRATLGIEVPPGSHATELTIPLVLPDRPIEKIAQFSGQMTALVPGKVVDFRFTQLQGDKPSGERHSREQHHHGVTVTLDRVRQNHDLWEIHMRFRVDGPVEALQSHRGWVFQNLTYLQNAKGEVIDHAGFETVRQTEQEIGLAYFFDLPDAINNYTWVYRTPASIVRVPIKYELRNIPLP